MRAIARTALATLAAALSCSKPSGTTPTSSSPAAPALADPLHGAPCGALDCRRYPSPVEAFLDAVGPDPLVVAVGESHAPKGAAVSSSARRFAEDILPALAGRASDLL